MRHESPIPNPPETPGPRKPYAPPQIWEVGPLQAEFLLAKIERVNPRCAQRMRQGAEVREPAPARRSLRQLALRALALATTAVLLLVPILVVADFVGALRLHYATLTAASAVVIGWIVYCLALALGPGWLLDALPGILERSYGPRIMMLLIAVNLIADFAVLYRWSTLPPWSQ